jgi:hypothetical protein
MWFTSTSLDVNCVVCCSLNCVFINRSERYMSCMWCLIRPSRLDTAVDWTVTIRDCFGTERWLENAHTVARFKMTSTQDIIRAEAALWTFVSSCRSPLRLHQLKLIEKVFASGGLVASPDDHDYAKKLKRNVESREYALCIDKILELATSLPATSPRMWNIVACMLDHCAPVVRDWCTEAEAIMAGHITDEQCPSDVLPGIVEVLLVARSKFYHCERIRLPLKLQETVFAACTARDAYTSSSRRLDLVTGLANMFVQWSE